VPVYTQGNDKLLSALLNLFFQYDYKDEGSIRQIQADAYFCFARIMDVVELENVKAWKRCLDIALKMFLSGNKESSLRLNHYFVLASSLIDSSFVSFFVDTLEIKVWYRFFDWVLGKDCISWIEAFECFGCAYILHFKEEFLKCTEPNQFFEVHRSKFHKKKSVPLNVLLQILKEADKLFENCRKEINVINDYEFIQPELELQDF